MDTTYFEERSSIAAALRARLLALAIVTTTTAALLYLRFFNPATPGTSYYPSCPFHTLTGLNCPGCGTLRGLHQLTHGHLITALNYNALMVFSLPFLGYTFISYALVAARGRGLPKPFIQPVFIKALFWIVIAFWILRNVPVYPLTLLSP
ncbi:MAG TPA: DUF2752 domain-containing protein [Pyrinomonadaceae bacterium]|nr:DUF2752 domain-containing protein [Pyrinomonadaceae bacterium]